MFGLVGRSRRATGFWSCGVDRQMDSIAPPSAGQKNAEGPRRRRVGKAFAAAPARPARAPDFLGIGAQKAGTTWLDRNLRRHPGIWLPPIKEVHYFDELHVPGVRRWSIAARDKHGSRALKEYLKRADDGDWNMRLIAGIAVLASGAISDDWYRSIFAMAAKNRACGEITPEYSILPDEGIAHVLRLAPEVRIIFSMRDPIDRCWSHIRMMMTRANNAYSDAEMEKFSSQNGVLDRSDYVAIIDRWRRHVPEARFLTIFMDDIVTDPIRAIERVCGHLGVRFEPGQFSNLDSPVHTGTPQEIPPKVYDSLKLRLRPIYERLAERFPEIGQRWMEKHY